MKSIFLLLLILIVPQTHAKNLRVGTTSSFPPFSYAATDSGHLFGFDVELIEQICKRIDTSCEFVVMPYNDLFVGLKKGTIDLAVSAIIITPKMKNDFIFSIPYLKSYGRFVTTKESPIKTVAQIRNQKVGTRKDTPFNDAALQLFNNKVTVQVYPVLATLLEALKNKTIDVAFMNNEAAEYWVANGSNAYRFVGKEIAVGNGYVIVGNKRMRKLMPKINSAIHDIATDGTFLKIHKRNLK
ncbi:transporter substrate-binding domain-containing protein [Legionella shakespearei]|uniref:Arginine 3rd transport system periplasmic binding protein n=1 Tax=Legionella shakespearei DSM 23087 TaxID=1122169 RepID=A0A0W0YLA3_9GAMM|nr:transporter substrate-binding domain-containing protein [Legionella shakespearei]KTD57672.1 arginine 3rd transport system periplasmic binding protein [Legionella shakespearei DSM 23087]